MADEVQYAEGYAEVFGDSDSDQSDFLGFDLDRDESENSSDSDENEAESDAHENNQANQAVAGHRRALRPNICEDPFAGAYDHNLFMNFTQQARILHDLGNQPSESDIFREVFSEEAFVYMVLETNSYTAEQIARLRNAGRLTPNSCASNWRDTDIAEMKAWVGIVFLMGYIRLPNYYAYWWTNPLTRQQGIQQIMTRDRLLTILQFLHLCDNSQAFPAVHEDHDRIHKIRTFMEQVLIPLWQGAYYPEQDVSVDETLVAFKERTALMQYKLKKPHKWGLNVWTLPDQDSYVYNWDLYAGKKTGGAVEEHGLTYDVVTKLCRPIYNKGHHVCMDNYFSSQELFNELTNNQTGACGTLWVNKRGIPNRVKTGKPAKGDPPFTESDGSLLYISWTDKRQVNILSSVHNESVFRKQVRCKRGQGENPNDVYRIVHKPKAIEIYTKRMGGVDRADQKVALHQTLHQTTKWWKKVFFMFLRLLLSMFPNIDNDLHLRQRHFLGVNPARTTSGKQSLPDCVVCSDRKVSGGRKQMKFICIQCQKALCKTPCFKRHQTLKNYK